MNLIFKKRQNIKELISNFLYYKQTAKSFSILNSNLLYSDTNKNEKPKEMDKLKDNPYFEKYKTKIKAVYE